MAEKKIQIETGGKKVIATGSFFTLSATQNKLVLELKEHQLELQLEFIDDPSLKPRFAIEPSGEYSGRMKLYNLNSALGLGSSEPIELGTFEGIKLFLHYRVYSGSKDSASKLFFYTFYSEDST